MRESSVGRSASGFAFLFEQRGEMRWIVYALMAVVRTQVPRDFGRAIEQATCVAEATSVSVRLTCVGGIE